MKHNMKQEYPQRTGSLQSYRYLIALIGLIASVYGINAMYKLLPTTSPTYKLMACSMSFVLTFTILNAIYHTWGTKRYFQAGAIALALNATSLAFHWSTWCGVIDLFSYLALYPAFFMNWWVLRQLEDKATMPWRLFLALATAILVDNAILMTGLVIHFGIARALPRLLGSIGLKLCYSAIAAMSIYVGNKFSLSARVSSRVASSFGKKD